MTLLIKRLPSLQGQGHEFNPYNLCCLFVSFEVSAVVYAWNGRMGDGGREIPGVPDLHGKGLGQCETLSQKIME